MNFRSTAFPKSQKNPHTILKTNHVTLFGEIITSDCASHSIQIVHCTVLYCTVLYVAKCMFCSVTNDAHAVSNGL